MVSISFYGDKALRNKLRRMRSLEPVRSLVKEHGSGLQALMQENAVFKRGYSTGATRQSIRLGVSSSGLKVVVGPSTPYAPYVEFGTRRMAPQSFVRPSFKVQKEKFKKDLEALFDG